ncbi:MAG: hypothetical protein ABJQ94_20590 [Roseobacter sp.]
MYKAPRDAHRVQFIQAQAPSHMPWVSGARLDGHARNGDGACGIFPCRLGVTFADCPDPVHLGAGAGMCGVHHMWGAAGPSHSYPTRSCWVVVYRQIAIAGSRASRESS